MSINRHRYPWWDRLFWPWYRFKGVCPHYSRYRVWRCDLLGYLQAWDADRPVFRVHGTCEVCGTKLKEISMLPKEMVKGWPRDKDGTLLDPKTKARLTVWEPRIKRRAAM